MKVNDLISAIEEFAPQEIKESWDNPGLQVGDKEMNVTSVMVCLDITEAILDEAISRGCNMVVTHHPLIFHGLRHLTGATATERIVARAIKENVAIYSAHTNLDSTWDGVSHEMAHLIGVTDLEVLEPQPGNTRAGLGVIGVVRPVPTLEFLRHLKKIFSVQALRYSANSQCLVVRKVAICGGSGASLIKRALELNADVIVTGDVKYHDFTTYGPDILIADIGHFESELCTKEIFSRLLRERFPELVVFPSEQETNPIGVMV